MEGKITYLSIFILLISFNTSFADTAIEYGDNIAGTIEILGQLDEYSFEGTAGDKVIVRMRDAESSIDACIELLAPSGNIVASDCGLGGVVIIDNVLITETGTYTIIASDNNNNDTGNYGLSLHVSNNPDFAMPISCGVEMSLDLEIPTQMNAYVFDVVAGDAAVIQMKSSNVHLESTIYLYDPAGNLLAMDESGSGGLARINISDLTMEGPHILMAMDNHGNDLGECFFNVQMLTQPACTEPISCGEDMNGLITDLAGINGYSFFCESGDVVVIQMRDLANAIESRIELYDPAGHAIDLDVSTGNLSRIGSTLLSMGGTYTLLALDNDGNDTGNFGLSVEVVTNADCVPVLSCSSLDQDFSLSMEGEIDACKFKASPGDVITFGMKEITNSLEPKIELYSPSGQILKVGKGEKEIICEDFTLEEDGFYTLLMMDMNGNDPGSYNMIFEAASNIIIDDSAPIVHCKNVSIAIPENGIATITTDDLDNGSSDACSAVSLNISQDQFTCIHVGENMVKLTATDDAGNESECEATVTIEDPTNFCELVDVCVATGLNTNYEWIEQVTFNTIDNVSGNDNGYGDYTDLNTVLEIGNTYPINLIPGFLGAGYLEYWRVWIDLNNNGSFEDDEMMLQQKFGEAIIGEEITIPDDAVPGYTTMRIVMRWGDAPEPCGNFPFGEVEDYRLELIPNTANDCGDIPLGWTEVAVGTAPIPGYVCYDETLESYTIGSAGYDIFETADEFHFVHNELCGDGQIEAYVTSVSDTGEAAGAGVMMRSTLDEDSKNATMLVTANKGVLFQSRTETGETTDAGISSGVAPYWVKLVREGDLFSGYMSEDGIDWEATYSTTISDMGECVLVGLAVSSYNENAINVSTFEGVSFGPIEGGLPTDESKFLTTSIEADQLNINGIKSTDHATREVINASASENIFQANEGNIQLKVFPNPTTDYIFVESNRLIDGDANVMLYDQQGHLVFQTVYVNNATAVKIDLAALNLPAGYYVVTLNSKGGTYSKQLLKQ